MNTYEELRLWAKGRLKHEDSDALRNRIGMPNSSFYRLFTGESPPRADKFIAMLQEMGVTLHLPDVALSEFSFIRKVSALAGAGSSWVTAGDTKGLYAFRSDFLSQIGVPPGNAVLMDAIGTSMELLIRDKDTILIDESNQTPRDGHIFVVGFEEELLVKRLQKTPRGWLLRSENRDFSDIPVEGADLEQFRVYGRVRWFGRVL